MNGTDVDDIFVDTGCTKTLVHPSLVPSSSFIPGENVNVRCTHGDVASYPLANAEIIVDDVPLALRVGVIESLPHSVLLGTDVPRTQLGKILLSPGRSGTRSDDALSQPPSAQVHEALWSSARVPSQQRKRDTPPRVYVGNLSAHTSKGSLAREFARYGPHREIWIARHPSRFALVEFENGRDAATAVRVSNGRSLAGEPVRVEYAKRPRRDHSTPRNAIHSHTRSPDRVLTPSYIVFLTLAPSSFSFVLVFFLTFLPQRTSSLPEKERGV